MSVDARLTRFGRAYRGGGKGEHSIDLVNGRPDSGSGLAVSLTEQLVCLRGSLVSSSPRLEQRPVLAAHGLRGGRDLAFGFMAGSVALDADQQLLIEHRQDAVEHRDREEVLAAFQLGDDRMRGPGSPGDLLLGQVQLVQLVRWSSLQAAESRVRLTHGPDLASGIRRSARVRPPVGAVFGGADLCLVQVNGIAPVIVGNVGTRSSSRAWAGPCRHLPRLFSRLTRGIGSDDVADQCLCLLDVCGRRLRGLLGCAVPDGG
jgi:hypothetical protein